MENLTLKKLKTSCNLATYQSTQVEETIELSKKVSKFYPCKPIFSVSEYDDKTHFEHGKVKLQHISKLDFTINYQEYQKKYYIFCDEIRKLKNIDSHTQKAARKKLTDPNKIGVLTTKKINDWINYYIKLYNALKQIDQENNNEKDRFLKSIENLPVQWYNNNKSGEVLINRVRLTFTIDETYINKKIEINYSVNNTVGDFLKLADNKYRE